jgi:hypothetical protein
MIYLVRIPIKEEVGHRELSHPEVPFFCKKLD